KSDWCYQNDRDKSLIDSPREELLKEFLDKAKQPIWFYSSSQFLEKANKYFDANISPETIEQVSDSVKSAINLYLATRADHSNSNIFEHPPYSYRGLSASPNERIFRVCCSTWGIDPHEALRTIIQSNG